MNKINNISNIKIAFLFVVFCNVIVDVAHKVFLQNIAFKVFDGSTQVIWISIINGLIIIPFLLLFTVSGYLSDKYNKKDITLINNFDIDRYISLDVEDKDDMLNDVCDLIDVSQNIHIDTHCFSDTSQSITVLNCISLLVVTYSDVCFDLIY